MALEFMSENAINFYKNKETLANIYLNYYTGADQKWVTDYYLLSSEDPVLIKWKTIPDFTLKLDLNGETRYQIDSDNCRILYDNLNFLTPSQAADERFWAGLSHSKAFYDFMCERWMSKTSEVYVRSNSVQSKISKIQTRFFFEAKDPMRVGFTHGLARFWWFGRLLYDPDAAEHYVHFDTFRNNPCLSYLQRTFSSFSFFMSQSVFNGFMIALEQLKANGIEYNYRHHVIKGIQLFNIETGTIVLDLLTEKEIADIFYSHILEAMQNDMMDIDENGVSEFDTSDDEYEEDELEEDVTHEGQPGANDGTPPLPTEEELMNTTPFNNLSSACSDEKEPDETVSNIQVTMKTKVHVTEISSGQTKTFIMDIHKMTKQIPQSYEAFKQKSVGDEVIFHDVVYRIDNIEPIL